MTNGYIRAEVLGQMRGLKFGMLAVQQITLQAQKLNLALGAEIDLALVPVIVYWGLFNNCYVKREDPDFCFEDVCDWVDENVTKTEVFTEIVKCFYDSRIIRDSMPEAVSPVEEEKKSSTSQKKKAGKS